MTFATMDLNYDVLSVQPGHPSVSRAGKMINKCIKLVGGLDQFIQSAGKDLIELPDDLSYLRDENKLEDGDGIYLIKI